MGVDGRETRAFNEENVGRKSMNGENCGAGPRYVLTGVDGGEVPLGGAVK